MSYRASAPGSLILLGEYAVLHGHPCLVAAIDQYIHVTLIPRRDDQITIFSSLAQHKTDRHRLLAHPTLCFVMETLRFHQAHLPSGCDIHIHADFSSQLGLGSSAAVTAALCFALAKWCDLSVSVEDLWKTGVHVIRQIQGSGSGADLAASLHGGLIAFKNDPLCIQAFKDTPDITVLYSGNKQSTAEALKQKDIASDWHERMGYLSTQGCLAITNNDWETLGKLMTQAHALLCERGVCSPVLQELVNHLEQQPTLNGAKISGAGYGDCVLALGKISKLICLNHTKDLGLRQLPISITSQGVHAC